MLECDITYEIEEIEEYLDEEKIREFGSFILKSEYNKEYEKNDYYLSLLITTNDVIRTINRDYRNKDAATVHGKKHSKIPFHQNGHIPLPVPLPCPEKLQYLQVYS